MRCKRVSEIRVLEGEEATDSKNRLGGARDGSSVYGWLQSFLLLDRDTTLVRPSKKHFHHTLNSTLFYFILFYFILFYLFI